MSSEHITNPHSLALQEKFARIGWETFVPTPGISDESKEIFITDEDEHFYVMTVREALTLSDGEFAVRLWGILYSIGNRAEAKAEYKRRVEQCKEKIATMPTLSKEAIAVLSQLLQNTVTKGSMAHDIYEYLQGDDTGFDIVERELEALQQWASEVSNG